MKRKRTEKRTYRDFVDAGMANGERVAADGGKRQCPPNIQSKPMSDKQPVKAWVDTSTEGSATFPMSMLMGYYIELGKYKEGEYSLFTAHEWGLGEDGWEISSQWGHTIVWKTTSKEAVRKLIERGYLATDEVVASLAESNVKRTCADS